jgi:prevent-host-death family protein
MKAKRNAAYAVPPPEDALVLRQLATVPAVGEVISVRAAKAHLSALLELVAAGREIVITSGGTPKVKLVSYAMKPKRKVFGGAARHLAAMPPWKGGPTAEELVRADRDARGW